MGLQSCKKEEPVPEPVLPSQFLSDTNIEMLQDAAWFSSLNEFGFKLARVDTVSLSPTHSLMITRTVSDTVNYAYYVQRYNRQMPVGKNLTLEAHIKGVNLVGPGVSILIRCDDSANTPLQAAGTQGTVTINGTFDWTSYTTELTNVDSQAATLYAILIFLPNTTGTVYFDDITLTRD
jgi:hypothetical protein